MKIAFIGLSGYGYPYVRVRCYQFARELGKHGISTSVISFRDHLSGGLSELEMWDRGDRDKVIMNLRAAMRIIRERPTIYYIQKIHYNAAVPCLFSRLTTTPFILDYDDWDEGIECLFKRPWLNSFFWGHAAYKDIFEDMARRARAVIVSSHYLRSRLSKYSDSVWMIPTGVDTDMFTPSRRIRSEKVVFAWTGVVWGEKMLDNVLFMLRCFRRVASRVRGVSLRIAGGGQLMGEVRSAVARDYRNMDIEILDWMPFDRMPAFLSHVDIGLLPLIQKGDPWVEGKSPTKYFEYMATGLPTVASRVGELVHIVTDGENGFLADGEEEFSEKMLLLARRPDLRRRMGVRAREKVRQSYALDAIGCQLHDVFKRIGLT